MIDDEDDMIWRLRWSRRWLYVYLLLEFQSSVDRFMAVRLLTYVGLLYRTSPLPARSLPEAGCRRSCPLRSITERRSGGRRRDLEELSEPDLPAQLQRSQPRFRYRLLEERRYNDAELAGLHNVAAALFRLENSRAAEDIERVLATLVEWLGAPEQTSLRRAFVVWLKRVLLPARVPGTDIPKVEIVPPIPA